MTAQRVNQVRNAVLKWASLDPSDWDTGLSTQGARLAQRVASEAILEGRFRTDLRAPQTLMIWCSSNVFTAPLEWVAQFAAMGTKIVLKAPSACPKPVKALETAFANLDVKAHHVSLEEAFDLLDGCDAVLGFGSDESMAHLDARLSPTVSRSLHGHKASLAIVEADNPELCAKGLLQDAVLYDGRGCMSPIAIFCLGDASALYDALLQHAESLDIPPGPLSLAEKAHLSRRSAIARMLGKSGELLFSRSPESIVQRGSITPLLLNKEEFEFLSLPRLLPIHPIQDLSELNFLKGRPWSSCATDLSHHDLNHLGFHRFCAPGELQRPPMNRLHDGVDVITHLCQTP